MPTPSHPRMLADLFQPFPARFIGIDPQREYQNIVDDSRRLNPQDLYLAIAGAQVDGHRFVPDAIEKQAVAAVVSESALQSADSSWSKLPLIVVANPNELRGPLAARHFGYPGEALRMVGLTGTNGKTTVNHLIAQIWSHASIAHARLGTTGHWLVHEEQKANFTTPFPLELQALLRKAVDFGASHASMESSSHAVSQGRIAGLQFDAIALTSFSQDHLDFHGSLASYLEAKLQLCEHLRSPTSPDFEDKTPLAVAPINAGESDDSSSLPAGRRFLERAQKKGATTYALSLSNRSDAQVACIRYSQSQGHTQALIRTPWGELKLDSPLFGRFNLENLMCAATITLGLGLPLKTVQEALSLATGAPGRLERILIPSIPDRSRYPAVYVDYAHTPDAVARAAQTLRDQIQGRLIIVLGCGGDRDRNKRPKMAKAAQSQGDHIIATSDNPRSEDPQAILDDMAPGLDPAHSEQIISRAAAITKAIEIAQPNDRVLIAGKGHETYQIIGTQTLPFDDREKARKELIERYAER